MSDTNDVKNEENETQQAYVEPENALPKTQLSELPEAMRDAAERAGWTKLMPVQQHAIPYMLAKRDLMVQSHTGSGKTGAFVLPLLERIDPSSNDCQALILVPTRELARQVEEEANLLAGDAGVRTVAVYGGVGYGPQIDAFKKGAHLVVGTPGRVLDHLLKRNLKLDKLDMLVFDEADRMLSMGFYPDMKQVQTYLPKRKINGYMFSATFPPHVVRLAAQFLDNPESLSLSHDHVHAMDTEHFCAMVEGIDKDRSLVRMIEIENPTSALIFCNTKANVHYVATVLQRFGYSADELSSDLGQSAREQVLKRIRRGDLRFLVATDVAARGIDIPDLSHVIQYEPPEDPEAYIHRAGRTGRAGAAGEAVTLVTGFERIEMQRIAKRYSIELQDYKIPTDEDVADVVGQRLTALMEARLRGLDKIHRERMERFDNLVEELASEETGRELLAMLLDDLYQQSLKTSPAPVEDDQDEKPSQPKSDSSNSSRSGRSRRGGRGGRNKRS